MAEARILTGTRVRVAMGAGAVTRDNSPDSPTFGHWSSVETQSRSGRHNPLRTVANRKLHLDSKRCSASWCLSRTTVTLEPEAERLLREAMRQRGQSFQEVLNQAVVQGSADLRCDAVEAPFAPLASPVGLRGGYDPALLDSLDGDMELGAIPVTCCWPLPDQPAAIRSPMPGSPRSRSCTGAESIPRTIDVRRSPRLELPISAGTTIQAAMPHPVPA